MAFFAGIVLNIDGFAKTHWTENESVRDDANPGPHNNNTKTVSVTYSDNETYLGSVAYLHQPNGNYITKGKKL